MTTTTDDIGTRALLTALNISAWSGNRLDRNASRDLTDRESAQRGAARVNKSLVSKDALAAVTTAAGAARSEHYKRTLAWADDGARILPAAGFLGYRDAMADRKSAFLDAVRVFVERYDYHRAQAQQSLGHLYSPADYPEAAEIAARFGFTVNFLPVPTGADFRVDLGNDARDALAAEIETRTRETMARAQAEPLKRVAETIGALAEKLRALQAHQGEGRAPVLRETALSNVLILADLLPSLNIHQDPALDTLAHDIKNAFKSHNVESLRTQPRAQEEAADAADDILARVAGIFGPAPVSYQHAAQ
jgi:hypothetical protein